MSYKNLGSCFLENQKTLPHGPHSHVATAYGAEFWPRVYIGPLLAHSPQDIRHPHLLSPLRLLCLLWPDGLEAASPAFELDRCGLWSPLGHLLVLQTWLPPASPPWGTSVPSSLPPSFSHWGQGVIVPGHSCSNVKVWLDWRAY